MVASVLSDPYKYYPKFIMDVTDDGKIRIEFDVFLCDDESFDYKDELVALKETIKALRCKSEEQK